MHTDFPKEKNFFFSFGIKLETGDFDYRPKVSFGGTMMQALQLLQLARQVTGAYRGGFPRFQETPFLL